MMDPLAEFRRICSVAWSADGTTIAAGDSYGNVACYTLSDRSFTSSFRDIIRISHDSDGPVTSLCPLKQASSSCGFVASSVDGTVAVFNINASSEKEHTGICGSVKLDCPVSQVHVTDFDGFHIVAACGASLTSLDETPCAAIIDSNVMQEGVKFRLKGHQGRAVTGVCAWGVHGVATCGSDGCALLWDLRSGSPPVITLKAPQEAGELCSVSMNRGNEFISCGSENGESFLWHVPTHELVARTAPSAEAKRFPIVDVMFSQEGTLLCSPLGGNQFVAYELRGSKAPDPSAVTAELAHVGILRESYKSTEIPDGSIIALAERCHCSCDDKNSMDDGVLKLAPRSLRAIGCANGTINIYDGSQRTVTLAWPQMNEDDE